MPPKKITSFRISADASAMLDDLAADLGLKKSSIIELAIREYHLRRFRGRKPKKKPKESP